MSLGFFIACDLMAARLLPHYPSPKSLQRSLLKHCPLSGTHPTRNDDQASTMAKGYLQSVPLSMRPMRHGNTNAHNATGFIVLGALAMNDVFA